MTESYKTSFRFPFYLNCESHLDLLCFIYQNYAPQLSWTITVLEHHCALKEADRTERSTCHGATPFAHVPEVSPLFALKQVEFLVSQKEMSPAARSRPSVALRGFSSGEPFDMRNKDLTN